MDGPQVNEEYKLYDFTTFITSVGGTLGLFIGFSFRDAFVIILDYVQNLFSKYFKNDMSNSKNRVDSRLTIESVND